MGNKQMLKQKGITLVALVITIVILLILAGISIAQLTGNGLFKNAKLAKEKYENEQSREKSTLGDYEDTINQYINGSRVDSDKNLGNIQLLLEATNTTYTTGTYTTNNFSGTEGEEFSKYLRYDDTSNAYKILEDGWYFINISQVLSSSTTISGHLNFLYNDILMNDISLYVDSNSSHNYDTDSLTLYMKKGNDIKFKKTLSGTGKNGNAKSVIKIFKI